MSKSCISIGSNLDNPKQQVLDAFEEIATLSKTTLLKTSGLIETAPWGVTNQPSFINAAALINTELSPIALLDELQNIEQKSGRLRKEKWGPRTLDLDIICFDNISMSSPRLNLPHPLFSEREFVLKPLSEICPEYIILEKTVSHWFEQFKIKNA